MADAINVRTGFKTGGKPVPADEEDEGVPRLVAGHKHIEEGEDDDDDDDDDDVPGLVPDLVPCRREYL
jgi:hypothetical protein